MRNIKKTIFILLIIIPNLEFCQIDSLNNEKIKLIELLKEIEITELLDESPECRVNYKSDSILTLATKHDTELSFKNPIKKYYRIGNASGIRIKDTQNLAIEKYKLWIEYTHCTPCKYQIEYNKIFEALYLKEFNIDLYTIIRNLEKEALNKDYKNLRKQD